jgi:hypothetical protein
MYVPCRRVPLSTVPYGIWKGVERKNFLKEFLGVEKLFWPKIPYDNMKILVGKHIRLSNPFP